MPLERIYTSKSTNPAVIEFYNFFLENEYTDSDYWTMGFGGEEAIGLIKKLFTENIWNDLEIDLENWTSKQLEMFMHSLVTGGLSISYTVKEVDEIFKQRIRMIEKLVLIYIEKGSEQFDYIMLFIDNIPEISQGDPNKLAILESIQDRIYAFNKEYYSVKMLTPHQQEQYHHQICLQGFGEEGQLRLINASVLVIGAGSLGCSVLQNLAATGIGTLAIMDDEIVSLSSLNGQVFYGLDDVGKHKVTVAAKKLTQLNKSHKIFEYREYVTNQIAWEIVKGFDVVIDASDNFETHFFWNDLCVLQKKPLVYGNINQFNGEIAVFNVGENSINFRDIFSTKPIKEEASNCFDIGFTGVLPGIIGSMMANETIKVILGIGKVLNGILLSYNSLENTIVERQIPHNLAGRKSIPTNRTAFEMMDY